MGVLKALLWRFHGADGGGRCFPGYGRIAAAAKCHRDTGYEAIQALEQAGILTWVNRITRTRRRERDLFGGWGSVWQVIRISNGYVFRDPLDRQPGRNRCKSENPARPLNPEKKKDGARLDGARVIQEELLRPLPSHRTGRQLLPNGSRAWSPECCDRGPSMRHWWLGRMQG
jgi:hypothetical protein